MGIASKLGDCGGDSQAAQTILRGRNIMHGFKARGYVTIGTGAVGWFNPKREATIPLSDGFDEFYYNT